MRIGVPKEIKVHEYRVGLTPASVRELGGARPRGAGRARRGARHRRADADYRRAGAAIVASAAEVFAQRRDDRQGQGAAGRRARACCAKARCCSPTCTWRPIPQQCRDLVASGAVCIAYETVTQPGGGLPLLAPMSEVAGRMAVQVGA